jgi:hypothetical protein
VTLLDANGFTTQPQIPDTIAYSATSGTFATASPFTLEGSGSVAASSLYDGVATVLFTAGSAENTVSTITVTPAGTLGALAAQSLTVTTDATTINTTAVTGYALSAPADAAFTVNAAGGSSCGNMFTIITAGNNQVSEVTIQKDDYSPIRVYLKSNDVLFNTIQVLHNIKRNTSSEVSTVKFTGSGTIKFSNSSLTINNSHYYPKSVRSAMYLERGLFIPEITTKKVKMAYCDGISESPEVPIACPSQVNTCPDATTYDICKANNVNMYRLTNSTVDIYNAIRHIGFPLFVGSFDFYCFMVSLMCDKSFYDSVVNDDKLYRLWSMMWLSQDLPNVERHIKEVHNMEIHRDTPRSASNITINIIRGMWLRCDIIQFLWALIKHGW